MRKKVWLTIVITLAVVALKYVTIRFKTILKR